jgi:hypothetical protein
MSPIIKEFLKVRNSGNAMYDELCEWQNLTMERHANMLKDRIEAAKGIDCETVRKLEIERQSTIDRQLEINKKREIAKEFQVAGELAIENRLKIVKQLNVVKPTVAERELEAEKLLEIVKQLESNKKMIMKFNVAFSEISNQTIGDTTDSDYREKIHKLVSNTAADFKVNNPDLNIAVLEPSILKSLEWLKDDAQLMRMMIWVVKGVFEEYNKIV